MEDHDDLYNMEDHDNSYELVDSSAMLTIDDHFDCYHLSYGAIARIHHCAERGESTDDYELPIFLQILHIHVDVEYTGKKYLILALSNGIHYKPAKLRKDFSDYEI